MIASSEVPLVFRAAYDVPAGWDTGETLSNATDEDDRIECLVSSNGMFSNREDGYRKWKNKDDPMFESTEGEGYVVQARMGVPQFLARAGIAEGRERYNSLTGSEGEVLYTYGGRLPGALVDAMRQPPVHNAAQHSLSRQWWCGHGNCVSKLHFDCEDGLMLQLSGTKRFDLFPPTDTEHIPLYDADTRWARQANFELDITNPDLERFPDFSKTHKQSVVLQPGDLLFIKSGWWHQVTSSPPEQGGLNVAFTWRWTNSFTNMDWPVSMQEYIY